MKSNNFILGIAAIFIAVSFAACSGGAKDQIARKWKMSDLKSPQIDRMMTSSEAGLKAIDDSIAATSDTAKIRMFTMQKDQTSGMMNMMKQKLEEMRTNSFMEFKKDGSYEANMGGNSEKGKWEIDGSGKWLISQTEGKEVKDSIMIDEVSAEKLVLSKDSTSMIFEVAPAESK